MESSERCAINDTPHTRLMSFRVPRRDIKNLNEYAARLGKTKTEIVIDGMRLALEKLQTETAQNAVPVK